MFGSLELRFSSRKLLTRNQNLSLFPCTKVIEREQVIDMFDKPIVLNRGLIILSKVTHEQRALI